MDLTGKRIGFAMTGSFCTFKKVLTQLEELVRLGADVTPIMSKTAFSTDTRFGTAENFRWQIENLCAKPILCELCDVEPIGPRSLLDLLIIAPCTGNTIAKLANGITDSAVTLAAKAHLRNQAPVLIAVSTNELVIIVPNAEILVQPKISAFILHFMIAKNTHVYQINQISRFFQAFPIRKILSQHPLPTSLSY